MAMHLEGESFWYKAVRAQASEATLPTRLNLAKTTRMSDLCVAEATRMFPTFAQRQETTFNSCSTLQVLFAKLWLRSRVSHKQGRAMSTDLNPCPLVLPKNIHRLDSNKV